MVKPWVLTYKEARSLVICGDIHGEFVPLVYEMCVRYGMRDTLVIVAGDCGFGFEKPGTYDQVFRRIEKRLTQNNCWIAMVRGNHDAPAYFATDSAGHTAIEHMRWRTVPDYAVIEACGRTVLCVGGAVSVDRQIRLQEMSRHPGKVYYWPDEAAKYDASALEAIRDAGLKVDIVVSHTAPSFCEFQSKSGLASWAKEEPELIEECEAERQTMDTILAHLKRDGHPLERWYYGHFHNSWHSEIDGVWYKMLDIMELQEVPRIKEENKHMKITLIAGARPNFMKVAPIIKAIKAYNESKVESRKSKVEYRLVHTGQHYDKNMSDTFFEELGIPAPDVNLGCGGGSQAEQTSAIMIAFEKELMAHPADIVLVVGDVTSTMACSIVAKKLNTKVCHVEAGIRSWDLTMPEEINRMVTDSLADYMFTTSDVANENLQRLGAVLMNGDKSKMSQNDPKNIVQQRVWFVGNVMIDTLLANRARFRKPEVWDELQLRDKEFVVMTMHRPANVDEENHLRAMMEQIVDNVHGLPVIFPIHPRTAKMLRELINERPQANSMSATESLNDERFPNLHIVEPMGYLEFNYLVERAKAVVTDSGGITEETTVMGVPCITLRDNTERPETCTVGTNELIGTNPAAIKPALDKLFAGEWKKGAIPELWDGRTAERIISILADL